MWLTLILIVTAVGVLLVVTLDWIYLHFAQAHEAPEYSAARPPRPG